MMEFIYTLPVNAEIIAVGSEMLTPHRQDTNSLHLTGHAKMSCVARAYGTLGTG
ncbi:MAG: hypothetical protein HYR57_03375 [Candidatus Koribacter versatilis]|nr:hypothetical protein [Candidatus Koribacter versatilis]